MIDPQELKAVKRTILTIRGLHTRDSATHVAKSLQATRGVTDVEIDLPSRSACVEYDEFACGVKDLIGAVAKVGLKVDGYNRPDAEFCN
jgi:copper chaperone CopZ